LHKGERSQSSSDGWKMGRDENHIDRELICGQLMGTGGANVIGFHVWIAEIGLWEILGDMRAKWAWFVGSCWD